jgi:hypothetical protein
MLSDSAEQSPLGNDRAMPSALKLGVNDRCNLLAVRGAAEPP